MSPVSRVSKLLVTAGDSPLADWSRRSSIDERYSRVSCLNLLSVFVTSSSMTPKNGADDIV